MRLVVTFPLSSDHWFTLSPDQKGIETVGGRTLGVCVVFTLSPDQKGIETKSCG